MKRDKDIEHVIVRKRKLKLNRSAIWRQVLFGQILTCKPIRGLDSSLRFLTLYRYMMSSTINNRIMYISLLSVCVYRRFYLPCLFFVSYIRKIETKYERIFVHDSNRVAWMDRMLYRDHTGCNSQWERIRKVVSLVIHENTYT